MLTHEDGEKEVAFGGMVLVLGFSLINRLPHLAIPSGSLGCSEDTAPVLWAFSASWWPALLLLCLACIKPRGLGSRLQRMLGVQGRGYRG